MIGRVIKIFSDFYYVETSIGIVEAKLRTVLKKQKAQVYTGDYVKLEQLDKNSMQAFIAAFRHHNVHIFNRITGGINYDFILIGRYFN